MKPKVEYSVQSQYEGFWKHLAMFSSKKAAILQMKEYKQNIGRLRYRIIRREITETVVEEPK